MVCLCYYYFKMQWNLNTCRICGEINENCHSIFNKTGNIQLEDKIKKCLKLNLFKDDFKPKQLCNPCLIKLNDFYDFLNISHATDQKFETILLDSRSHQHHQWEQSDSILDYTQQKMSVIVTAKPTIEPLDCTEIELYKESVLPLENCINEHEMLEIVESASSYTNLPENLEYLSPSYGVKKYPSEFYQESTVLRHSSTYQENSSVAINYSCQQEQPPQEEIYENYTNAGLDYSNYNARESVPETLQSFTNTSSNDSAGEIAPARKQTDRLFPCPHCEKKFKRRVSLNSHIAIHTKIRPFLCEICNKSFAIKCDLTNHRKVHTDRNKCKFCSSTFPAPSKLQRHLRTHTKDKPFKCDYKNCIRSFSDKRNLTAHKLLHSNVFDFSCKDCGKVFRTKNRLKQHEKSHSDSSPGYVCEICSKSYKYKSTLIFHLKKHNGYICSFCEKDFEKPVKLIKHKRVCPKKPG